MEWDAPGEPVRDYRVSWAKVGDDFRTWTVLEYNGFPTAASYTISGLEGGSRYKVMVRARYDGSAGPWTGEYEATVMDGGILAADKHSDSGDEHSDSSDKYRHSSDKYRHSPTSTAIPATNTAIPATNTSVPPTNTAISRRRIQRSRRRTQRFRQRILRCRMSVAARLSLSC